MRGSGFGLIIKEGELLSRERHNRLYTCLLDIDSRKLDAFGFRRLAQTSDLTSYQGIGHLLLLLVLSLDFMI